MTAGEDQRPEGPAFFLSYVRPRAVRRFSESPNGKRVTRFFDDLCEEVAELLAVRTGDTPGFIDDAMDGGVRWNDELCRALGTCQVFVPLLADSYLNSQWCIREWGAFKSRLVSTRHAKASPNGTAILPVLWTPMLVRLEDRPAWMREVQTFSLQNLDEKDAARRYENDGVYGLLATRDKSSYDLLVWRLALRIRLTLSEYLVAPRDLAADWAEPEGRP